MAPRLRFMGCTRPKVTLIAEEDHAVAGHLVRYLLSSEASQPLGFKFADCSPQPLARGPLEVVNFIQTPVARRAHTYQIEPPSQGDPGQFSKCSC
jgi:hypothetical protein